MEHPRRSRQPVAVAAPPPRRRPSITGRLRLSYLISSTLPLLLVGLLLIVVLFRVQQRNAYDSQQAIADKIAGNISTFLYDLEQLLLRSGRELRPAQGAADLAGAAARLVNSSPDLRAITVFDAAGAVVAQAGNDLLAGRGEAIAPADQQLVADTLSIGQGGRSDIRPADDGHAYFLVALPIRDPGSGTIVGALSAEVSAVRVGQILRLAVQGQDKVAYVVNSRRELLITDGTRGWSPPPDLGPLFAVGQMVGEYPGGDGQRMVGARAAISPVTPTSWSVVVEQPASTFFVEVYRSILVLAAVVALVGVLALTWALYQSRQIVGPIRELTAGAHALAQGRLEQRIGEGDTAELGQLASSFNQMAEQLLGSLHQIEQQNERLRRGIELARDIQQGMLPIEPPWQTEILSVSARSLPASEVGGDFYTYLSLSSGQVAIAIGDISGKGVAAALLMALASSTLESQVRLLDEPSSMLGALHHALRRRLQANQMNAAMQIAVYNQERRTMTIANAGMIAPLLVRAPGSAGLDGQRCGFIDVGGLPIGTPLDMAYRDVEVALSPGDTLIFLSDGIVEAHNAAGELFGFERLEALVADLPPHLSVAQVVQQILDAVLAYAGEAEPHDDITIIATRPAIGRLAEIDPPAPATAAAAG